MAAKENKRDDNVLPAFCTFLCEENFLKTTHKSSVLVHRENVMASECKYLLSYFMRVDFVSTVTFKM